MVLFQQIAGPGKMYINIRISITVLTTRQNCKPITYHLCTKSTKWHYYLLLQNITSVSRRCLSRLPSMAFWKVSVPSHLLRDHYPVYQRHTAPLEKNKRITTWYAELTLYNSFSTKTNYWLYCSAFAIHQWKLWSCRLRLELTKTFFNVKEWGN